MGGASAVGGRRVRVAGYLVDEVELRHALASGDGTWSERVVRQIREDRRQGAVMSPALVVLCSALRPYVLARVRRAGLYSATTIDDAWADTLVRVYERIDQFDPARASLKWWVALQAVWAASDLARKWDGAVPVGERVQQERASAEADPAVRLLDDADAQAMRRAFGRLSARDQKLVFMRTLFGCRHAEIAAHPVAAGLNEATVRVYVNRATKRLRRLYEQESAGRTETTSVAIDDHWPVGKEADETLPELACLEADVAAVRTGRLLTLAIDPAVAEHLSATL